MLDIDTDTDMKKDRRGMARDVLEVLDVNIHDRCRYAR